MGPYPLMPLCIMSKIQITGIYPEQQAGISPKGWDTSSGTSLQNESPEWQPTSFWMCDTTFFLCSSSMTPRGRPISKETCRVCHRQFECERTLEKACVRKIFSRADGPDTLSPAVSPHSTFACCKRSIQFSAQALPGTNLGRLESQCCQSDRNLGKKVVKKDGAIFSAAMDSTCQAFLRISEILRSRLSLRSDMKYKTPANVSDEGISTVPETHCSVSSVCPATCSCRSILQASIFKDCSFAAALETNLHRSLYLHQMAWASEISSPS